MAQGTYTDFPTVATQDTWTAAQHNTYLRDNLGYLLSMAEPTMTNKSGSTRSQGDLVKVDTSNDSSFTTTTTASDTGTFGVVASASIANNSTGRVAVGGIVTIQTTGTVTRGDYLESSTTAGKAKSAGTTKTSATFAMALTTASAGTCTALILPSVSSVTAAYVLVRHSTTQSIPDDTLTALSFDTEFSDTHAFHSTSVNTSRLTVPTGLAGVYFIFASTGQNLGVGQGSLSIRLNGTTIILRGKPTLSTEAIGVLDGGYPVLFVSGFYSLADADYIEAMDYITDGARSTNQVANYFPNFGMVKVG